MPFDKTPTEWIPSWSEDGTDINVPIASFPELTDVEADGASGDIRKIVYAACSQLWQTWADLPSGDRPTKMTVNRQSFVNETTGVITRTFTVSFQILPTGEDVISET